jgi:NADPH:quinone reductase-like Zn-dependent oxidoreductase
MFAFTTLGDGIDALKRIDTAIPEIGAEEILVKITAVSLNYRDLLVINGVEHWKPKTPRIPISDGVGKIVGIGSNVTKWAVGERVIGTFLPY